MANLRIAHPFLLSGPTQNRFKRLYFWLKFLSDLAKGVVAPSPPVCTTAYTVGAKTAWKHNAQPIDEPLKMLQ